LFVVDDDDDNDDDNEMRARCANMDSSANDRMDGVLFRIGVDRRFALILIWLLSHTLPLDDDRSHRPAAATGPFLWFTPPRPPARLLKTGRSDARARANKTF
jgi:hypothetical protein